MRLRIAATAGAMVALALAAGADIAAAQDYDRTADDDVFGPFFVDPGDSSVLYLDGEIEALAPFHLTRALDAYPLADTLVLNSDGGDIGAALSLAVLIADAEMATIVPPGGGCFSACAVVYIAGDPRNAVGALGVHQFTSEEPNLEYHLDLVSDIVELAVDHNVAPGYILEMLRTPADEMHIFSAAELDGWGLEIGVVAADIRPLELAANLADYDIDVLIEVLEDPELIAAAMVAGMGPLSPELTGITEAFAAKLARHPRFSDYLIEYLMPDGEAGAGVALIPESAAELGNQLFNQGIARLPVAEQVELMSFTGDIVEWLLATRPDECLTLVDSDMGSPAALPMAMEFLADQGEDYAIGYFALVLRAAFAELDGHPPIPTLSAADGARIEADFLALMLDTLAELDDDAATAIFEPSGSTEFCESLLFLIALVENADPAFQEDLLPWMMLSE